MKNTKLTMGAQTIAAALAFGSGAVMAQENVEKCDEATSAECKASSDEAIELIRIHSRHT